jgi:transposase
MARAYSLDLRHRVLAACDAGGTSREVAQQYQVSRAWVDRLKQRRRETGEIGPRRPARFRPSVLAGQMEQLRALVTAQPDLTLAELRHALGVGCSLTAVWRALRRLHLTRKKSPSRARTNPA